MRFPCCRDKEGMEYESRRIPKIGDQVTCKLNLGDHEKVQKIGTVVHVNLAHQFFTAEFHFPRERIYRESFFCGQKGGVAL